MSVRLFVAMEIPEQVRQAMTSLRQRLEKVCTSVKCVRIEGAHLTLKFIGYVPDAQVDAIGDALRQVNRVPPIAIRFAGLGFFPNDRRPRVFWAGIEGGTALAQPAAHIRETP